MGRAPNVLNSLVPYISIIIIITMGVFYCNNSGSSLYELPFDDNNDIKPHN